MEGALSRYNAGDYPGALAAVEAVLARRPPVAQQAEALLLGGAAHFRLGDMPASVAWNAQALQVDPTLAEALSNMGNAVRALGDVDRAVGLYRRAIALKPGFCDVYNNLAAALLQQGERGGAAEAFATALRHNPSLVDAWVNLGTLARLQGRREEAAGHFRQAVAIAPTCKEAWLALGGMAREAGDLAAAAACFQAGAIACPASLEVATALATTLREAGQLPAACAAFQRLAELRPGCAFTHANLATCRYDCGDMAGAVASYQAALALEPRNADYLNNAGNAYRELGRLDDAVACYTAALAADPAHPHAHNNLGNAFKDQGRLWDAVACYTTACTLLPRFAAGRSNLASVYKEVGAVDAAVSNYCEALRIDPTFADAWSNLGNVLKDAGRVEDAIRCYSTAIAYKPAFADAFANLAASYKESGRVAESIGCYRRALALKPAVPDTVSNLSHALMLLCDWRTRAADFRAVSGVLAHQLTAVLGADVVAAAATVEALTVAKPGGRDAGAELDAAVSALHHGLARGATADAFRAAGGVPLPCVQPFHALVYPLSAWYQLLIARAYAMRAYATAHAAPAARTSPAPVPLHRWAAVTPLGKDAALFTRPPVPTAPSPTLSTARSLAPDGRLRVGYVSSDFGNHPLSHLMGSVFGMHDRTRFEVWCFALSPDDGSVWRARIAAAVEHFVDCTQPLPPALTVGAAGAGAAGFPPTNTAIAAAIAAAGIHVLVNLNGYTKGARNEIFALRPAPIAATYMGFCGSLGAPYVDYLVADATVIPAALERAYDEAVVLMPHSYFVNDHRQAAREVLNPAAAPPRGRYGVPAEPAFVFASFGQLYKVDPATFATWCAILARVPGSVLWLLRFPAAGEANMRAAARAFGVSDDRLVFTDVATKEEHLRRAPLVDLFLDTPACNSHTTGCDTLWGGVPMVTLPGEKMASRVAASLLNAAGLSCCVARTWAEYEELAVALATDRPRLHQLRAQMQAARDGCPLFDTARWVRNLEAAYHEMGRRWMAGETPTRLVVREADAPDGYQAWGAVAGQPMEHISHVAEVEALPPMSLAAHHVLLPVRCAEAAARRPEAAETPEQRIAQYAAQYPLPELGLVLAPPLSSPAELPTIGRQVAAAAAAGGGGFPFGPLGGMVAAVPWLPAIPAPPAPAPLTAFPPLGYTPMPYGLAAAVGGSGGIGGGVVGGVSGAPRWLTAPALPPPLLPTGVPAFMVAAPGYIMAPAHVGVAVWSDAHAHRVPALFPGPPPIAIAPALVHPPSLAFSLGAAGSGAFTPGVGVRAPATVSGFPWAPHASAYTYLPLGAFVAPSGPFLAGPAHAASHPLTAPPPAGARGHLPPWSAGVGGAFAGVVAGSGLFPRAPAGAGASASLGAGVGSGWDAVAPSESGRQGGVGRRGGSDDGAEGGAVFVSAAGAPVPRQAGEVDRVAVGRAAGDGGYLPTWPAGPWSGMAGSGGAGGGGDQTPPPAAKRARMHQPGDAVG